VLFRSRQPWAMTIKRFTEMRFLKNSMTALTVAVSLFSSNGYAATADIPFGGTISRPAFCRIFVRQAGTLVPSPDNLQLSSNLTGGSAGIADVWAIFPYQVTAETVPFFAASSPPGANTGVTMGTTFSGTSIFNGSNFAFQNGSTPITLNPGLSGTRIRAHLTATRATPFPVGSYSTQVTIRCE